MVTSDEDMGLGKLERRTETLAEADLDGAWDLMEFLHEHLNSSTKVHVQAKRAVIFRVLETGDLVLQLTD